MPQEDYTRLLLQSGQEYQNAVDMAVEQNREVQRRKREQAIKQQQLQQEQSKARYVVPGVREKDAKSPKDYNATDNVIEAGDSLVSGVVGGTKDLLTFPERAIDYTTEEYQKQTQDGKEWKPDFTYGGFTDTLNKVESEYQPRTFWGNAVKGITKAATIAGELYLGARAAAAAAPAVVPASMLASVGTAGQVLSKIPGAIKATNLAKNALGASGTAFAAAALVNEDSQQGNVSQAILDVNKQVKFAESFGDAMGDWVPWLPDSIKGSISSVGKGTDSVFNTSIGWLAVNPADNPWVKSFKNVVEGLLLDVAAHKVGEKLFGSKQATNGVTEDTNVSPTSQVATKDFTDSINLSESYDALFPGEAQSKYSILENQSISLDNPNVNPDAVLQTINDLQSERGYFSSGGLAGNEYLTRTENPGSQWTLKREFDAVSQANWLSRSWPMPGAGSVDNVLTPAQARRMAKENGMLETELQATAREYTTDARYEQMMAEAKAANMTFDQVYGYAFKRMQEVMGRDLAAMDAQDFWSPMQSNLDKLGGIETWAMKDVVAADLINASILTQIRDLSVAAREIVDAKVIDPNSALLETLKDRLTVGLTNVKRSRYLIGNQFRQLQGPEVTAAVDGIREQTDFAVEALMTYAKESENPDVLKAILEAFSMSNKIQNWTDLDAYMRSKLRGGGFLKGEPGAVIKELNGVMIHSILSGPKTPVRAVMGTGSVALLRPIATAVGGVLRADWDTARASLSSVNAMREVIPEAWKLMKTRVGSYMSGEMSTIKTRFYERTKADDDWAMLEHWVDTRGSDGDKAAFVIADFAKKLNDNSLFTYSTKLMKANDDTFEFIMARARAREKAMRAALDQNKIGQVSQITPKLIKDYEDQFYKQLLDENGDININSDLFLKASYEEATLTKDLSGFAKGLETLFNKYPYTKPFYLFARTAVNGLELSYKNTPLLGLLHKESFDILNATSNNLETVAQYGITSLDELDNAKALIAGRQAIGGSLVTMAGIKYLEGGMTGNGPQDKQLRNLWLSTGWQPRSILINGAWVSYENIEPFNVILASIADIGDNMKLMGQEWANQNLFKISMVLAGAATSKAVLTGLGQFVDLFTNGPGESEKIIANLANNQVPLAGLRNEIGRFVFPHMRELNSGLVESIRNRNLITEGLTANPLPEKYDLLNGEPLRNWNFMERMYNMFSPIPISFKQSPGRQLLWNSNYDVRLISYTSPDGISLKEHPEVRSLFQKAFGEQQIEKDLDLLATDPSIKASVEAMYRDRDTGKRFLEPVSTYMHNKIINNLIENARNVAWAKIKSDPKVQRLYTEKDKKDIQKRESTANSFAALTNK